MGGILASIPGATAQGLIWGVMALGVYVTYKLLDIADLTVDSSLCTGGATSAMLILAGFHPIVSLLFAALAGMAARLGDRFSAYPSQNSGHSCRYSHTARIVFHQPPDHGKIQCCASASACCDQPR